MITKTVFLLIFVMGFQAYGQENDCKVTLANISGSYSGACKNGLAHGKGIAKGIDRYEGQFRKGTPNGKGIYRWADGSYYDGQWKDGFKEGKGKLVSADSTTIGYWNKDVYIGEKFIQPFEISRTVGVSRSSIRKSAGSLNEIRIRLMQSGADNTSVSDFNLSYSSGDEYRNGNVYGIQNVKYPVTVNVRYKSLTAFKASQFQVIYEFTINDPGTWDVIISN